MKEQILEIGKIVSSHGLKGEVKIQPWCDDVSVIMGVKNLYLGNKTDLRKVESAKAFKGMAILKLEGVKDIDEANKLRGKIVYADRKEIAKDDDAFFIVDLIGLTVKDANTGEIYGEITDVSETGANDVYHVTKDGKTTLIPAIPLVVKSISLEENLMLITPLEGLFDED